MASKKNTILNQVEERQKFWEAFKSCLEENRIAPDRSRYYVHRVKVFIDLHGLNRPGLTVKSPADL